MPDETDDQRDAPRGLSRRNLFKRAGVVGVVAATSGTTLALTTAVTARAQTPAPATPLLREALETLTAAESDILEAIVARLIPADENGPGATEARAAHYIDRALAGPLSSSRRAYAVGLAAVNAYAQSAKGVPFATLAYGGNANFVGWDLIGYPGLRMAVTEDDQRMSVKPTPNRRSAYDVEMFAKKGGGHGHKP